MAMTPRDGYLRRTYGLTEEEYLLVLEFQGGRCYICLRRTASNLHVDHDHRTGIIRGLLCVTCNHDLLGRRDKDPDLFTRAAEYLVSPPAVAVLGEKVAPSRPKKKKRRSVATKKATR